MIIDEAGIERLEHLLWPFWFGVNNAIAQQYKNSTVIITILMILMQIAILLKSTTSWN